MALRDLRKKGTKKGGSTWVGANSTWVGRDGKIIAPRAGTKEKAGDDISKHRPAKKSDTLTIGATSNTSRARTVKQNMRARISASQTKLREEKAAAAAEKKANRPLTTKQKMRARISASSKKLRDEKAAARAKKKANKPYISPYERKHGKKK